MNFKTKDVLHLYMGAHCEYEWTAGLHADLGPIRNRISLYLMGLRGIRIRLILRPLSTMTKVEFYEFARMESSAAFTSDPMPTEIQSRVFSPATLVYLLSRGFDMFGLIDSGEAIDATKLEENPYNEDGN